MTGIHAAGDGRRALGQAYKDKTKPADIRASNINAAKGMSSLAKFPSIYKPRCHIVDTKNLSHKICGAESSPFMVIVLTLHSLPRVTFICLLHAIRSRDGLRCF